MDDEKILEFSDLKNLFSGSSEKFKIKDKKIIEYDKIFKSQQNVNVNELTGFSYSENFHYYFKYPEKEQKFIYNYSPERSELVNMDKEEKVRDICGNFGIGKSTSLLAARLVFHEIVYFNLKALIQNLNIYIWKYELLLKEIAFSFKYTSNYENFLQLKQKIEKKNNMGIYYRNS